jgi:transcriptional regulator with XRE-family HTH domain
MEKQSEISEKEISFRNQVTMDNISKNLRKERLKQNMSRVELAFYAKITESMVCDLENGRKTGISIYTLVKLSQALDVNLCILLET